MNQSSSSNSDLAIVTHINAEEPLQQVSHQNQEPTVGMVFLSSEEVCHFYKEYGKQQGFGVMIKHSNKRADGRCRRIVLCCCKAGKAPDESSRPSVKTGCGAKIVVKLWGDGLLHLMEVHNEHNHPFSPSLAIPSSCGEKIRPTSGKKRRKISHEGGIHPINSYPAFVLQGGGYESLGFGQNGRDLKPVIRVAAICGSLRRASFNRGLVQSAIQLSKESVSGLQIEHVDISSLPFLNPDLEVNGMYPPPVEAFRQKILEADSILFASPEYNYSLTGCLKNAIDWASRPPNAWANKSAAIVSAGDGFGGGRSQYHLRQVGVFLDIHFINKPELFVKVFEPPVKFNTNGNLIDPETKERLKQVLLSLQAFTHKLQGKTRDYQTL